MLGPKNKQKVAKLVQEDDEIAIELLHRKRERNTKHKINWKRFLHCFGIHNYNKRIKQDNKNMVVKCDICGALHCTSRSWMFPSVIGGIVLLIFGLGFGSVGTIAFLIGLLCRGEVIITEGLAGFLGLLALWYVIKRFLERFRMDEAD